MWLSRQTKTGVTTGRVTNLKEVHDKSPDYAITLNRVGVTNLEYPVRIQRGDKEVLAIVRIKASVDLPENQKGVHMSRFIEEIEETFETPLRTTGIENLAQKLAEKQLGKHPYARSAFVELETKTHLGNRVYTLTGSYDTGTKIRRVGVSVEGALACPCAMGLTGGLSHNQRGKLTIEVGTNTIDVDAEDLVRIADNSFSSPLRLRLKRFDEKVVVEKMHKNPMFVEDVVRRCVHLLRERYGGCYASVVCVSYESIHPFNVFAQWWGRL